tara:strand:+ start:9971 stop:10126 length:156 start_codon:yes stop_codon:yes gene_type:complete
VERPALCTRELLATLANATISGLPEALLVGWRDVEIHNGATATQRDAKQNK